MLLLDLERAETLQTTARGHVEELQLQLDRTDSLRPEDIDLLKRIELDQRQLESRMTDDLDGLESRARSIQAERESNNVEDPESTELLETLAGELSFLRTDALPQIRQKLSASDQDCRNETGLVKGLARHEAGSERGRREAGRRSQDTSRGPR